MIALIWRVENICSQPTPWFARLPVAWVKDSPSSIHP